MKNLYCNRLRKNKDKEFTINSKSSFPLMQYINNGNKLNSLNDIYKIGVNRSEHLKYMKQSNNSNNLIKSYNQSGTYMQNYQSKNKNNNIKCTNHSLYDSNKQKIIDIENNHNYVRFESNFFDKEKNNKKYNLSINNSIYNSTKNNNNSHNYNNNVRNYTFQKNYFNNNITNINYNIKIQNFTKKNTSNNSLHTINLTNSTKNNKYISILKNDLMQNRNYLSNLKNNYNFTEINESKKNKSPNILNQHKNQTIQRNYTENNYKKEKEKEKDKTKESHSPSIIKTQILSNIKNDRNNLTNNKTNIHIYDLNEDKYKINFPIKLNIEDINKEKLSRLKRIIEQSSTNLNFYKTGIISKNFFEKEKNSQEKIIKVKKGKTPYVFKKKKINMIKKEENKEDDINNKKQKISNNILIKSTNKKMHKKKNLILSSQFYNTNYKFDSGINSHNLFTQKNKNKNTDYNKEIKNQIFKCNEINNGNNDDTISLSYSKEQNLSYISKRNNINEKNLFLPFSIEQFNIFYNKKNKGLKINDKNKYVKNIENESDDDDYYQLTKEIILLKRGLAKKSELSNDLKRKIKNMRMQRVYTINLLGIHKVLYRKKMSNYKLTKL